MKTPDRPTRSAASALCAPLAALALISLALAPPAAAQEESAGAKGKGKAAAPSEAAAEPTAKSDAKAPPVDPFVKAREASEGAEGEAGGGGAHTNVGALFQYIDVPRERWQGWLAANEPASDAGALRQEAERWIAAGEAELAETSLVMGSSGQRMRVDSVQLVIHASAFKPSNGSSQPFPAAHEPRIVGMISEVDPVLEQDGSVDFNFAPERSAYLGERPPREEIGVAEGDLRWPYFGTQKVSATSNLGPQQWALVGSKATLERPESHETLVFVRPLLHRFEWGVGAGGDGAAGAAPEADLFRPSSERTLTFTWLEVPHETLNTSLMQAEDASAWAGGGLHRTMREAGASVLEERVVRVRSGQRTKSESIRELRFPTEFNLPEEGGGPFATPGPIDTWNLGVTVEVDTFFRDEAPVLQLNFAAERLSHHGANVLHRVLVGGEWRPNYTMPKIHRMKASTQLTLPLGVPVLAAILSPPDEEGWNDPSRKVLLFVKVSP